jgi:hypothetical protein
MPSEMILEGWGALSSNTYDNLPTRREGAFTRVSSLDRGMSPGATADLIACEFTRIV